MSREQMCVFSIPSSNNNNKYIELFISAIQKADADLHVETAKNNRIFSIFGALRSARAEGENRKNILHIQWSTALYGSRFLFKSALLLLVNTAMIGLLKKVFHLKVVWTMHNYSAHDYPHPSMDRIGRGILLILADAVIVQQEETLRNLKERYPWKEIFYIPHGNYINAYGPAVQRDEETRKSLGFAKDDIVLLSFGLIAPYKRNEKIIDAVSQVAKTNPKLKLLIIGKGESEYVRSLTRRASEANIFIENSFIPDKDMPRYLAMADFSVFYYDHTELTSGGVLLSLSYGLPVIVRNIPGADVIDARNGMVFEDDAELVTLLQVLKPSVYGGKKNEIIGTVRSLDWGRVGARIVEIYKSI